MSKKTVNVNLAIPAHIHRLLKDAGSVARIVRGVIIRNLGTKELVLKAIEENMAEKSKQEDD